MKKLIYALALVKFILPFLLQHSAYEPHRDEFLYLAEARHLAWGYLELPPVLSVLSFITNALGGSLFWIRFWPSLGGALTYVLVGRMILLLGGGRYALILGFLPFIFGYFVHVHFILQPNFLEMLAWTTMAYGLMRYVRSGEPAGHVQLGEPAGHVGSGQLAGHVRSGEPGGLYIAGLGFGLGMMSKYSVAFFAGCLLIGLLLTPERKVFRNRHFYGALLLGFLLFLPNLIWQGVHGWPIFNHMMELRQEQLDQVSRLNFLLDQLTYNLPGLACWGAGLYWLFGVGDGKRYRFVGWAVVLVLAFLVLSKGKSYYAMGAYPVLFACGAVCLERITALRRGWRWSLSWRWSLVAFSVIAGCYIDMVALPMLEPQRLVDFYTRHPSYRRLGFLRWEDQRDHPLPQDFADMLGWKEMAAKTAKAYHSLDSSGTNHTVIDGGNYGEAGAMDYYGPAYGLPGAMGRAANYLLWTPVDFYKGDKFILVTDYRGVMKDDMLQKFASVKLVDSVSTPFAREGGSIIIVMQGPSAEARKQWSDSYEEAREKISVFHRKG